MEKNQKKSKMANFAKSAATYPIRVAANIPLRGIEKGLGAMATVGALTTLLGPEDISGKIAVSWDNTVTLPMNILSSVISGQPLVDPGAITVDQLGVYGERLKLMSINVYENLSDLISFSSRSLKPIIGAVAGYAIPYGATGKGMGYLRKKLTGIQRLVR